MSLKAVLSAAVALLGALALAAAVSLIVLATNLQRTTSNLGAAVEGVRVAEALEVDLLSLHRVTHPLLSDLEASAPLAAGKEESLRALLSEARRETTNPEEQALLAQAERGIADYFLVRERAAELSPERLARELGPSLDVALASLERLVDYNVAEARAAQAQAARWERLSDIAGFGVAALLLLGGAALLLWLRRFAFRPLLDISRAMQRFGSGRKRTRAPEQGPAELREMARTFNEMANSLSRQQEAQLTFLAGVAHDLRNPLSALKMSAALLTAGRPLPEERMQKTLALIRRQVARLDRMVGDLLDATRIEAGRFELQLEEHDACDVAREVVELYRAGGSSHDLRLELPEEPLLLRCDSARLEQVMHNLVSNALKYSPTGSRVDVGVAREGEEVVLSVVDRGIGISTEEMRNLFVPFKRAGKARERTPGVGLGLSVSRRIVEAHGGRIEVESRPGVGSAFRVRLPLHPAIAHPPARPGEEAPGPSDALH